MNSLTSTSAPQIMDRRAVSRHRTLKVGKLIYGGFSSAVVDCLVVELSEDGARVETPAMTRVPELLKLRVGDEPERQLRRCWAQGNYIGLEFIDQAE